MIKINIEKAKLIKKEKLRIEREPLLQAQDIAFQRALEEGKSTEEIITEKQRLRDITKLVDNAQSIEELSAIKIKA